MMRRLARFILPVLVFVVGFAAGSWFSIGRRAAAFSAGVDRRLAEAPQAAPTPAPGQRAFPSDEEMLTAVMSAVVEEEPLLRAYRLRELLGRLGSEELAALFARALLIEDAERRGELLRTLLARWAAVDPAAADAATRPSRDRFHATGRWDWQNPDCVVSVAWAQALPQAALAEAMAAPSARWAETSARAALQSLAEDDPARQLEALAKLPANRLRTRMCLQTIRSLEEKDPVAAEAALGLVSDERQRAGMQMEVLGKLAEKDPQAGLARLAATAPDLASNPNGWRLSYAILQAAAKKEPSAALDAIAGLPEALRTQARDAVLAGWASEHPGDALEWASANGAAVSGIRVTTFYGDDGMSSNSLAGVALGRDREKTLAWLRAQPASPERDLMLHEGMWQGNAAQRLAIYADLTPAGRVREAGEMAGGLYQEDRERALAWARELPAGEERAAAVRSLVARQARTEPDRVDALIDGWPAGPDRDAALAAITGNFSQNQPTRALDYARRIGDPAARETAFYNLASLWFNRDAAGARAWVAGTTEISADLRRTLARRFDER